MGGPKRSLWETAEVKSGLLWRTQVTEDAKAVEVLPKRPLHIALETAQREMYAGVSKVRGTEPLNLFGVDHKVPEFDVCLPEIWTCFQTVFPYYVHYPSSLRLYNNIC